MKKKVVMKKKQRNRPKKSFLYGRNSVLERLKSNPGSIQQVFISGQFADKGILNLLEKKNVPVKSVSEKELMRVKRADRLQGIVARVDNFKYTEIDDIFAMDGICPVFLDRITDPHNLGAIIRTLACLGRFAVVIGRHGSCPVNDTVMHVASGGENYVPVAMVNNLPMAILKAKAEGFFVYGSIVQEGRDISDVSFAEKTALVLGAEGKGISPSIRKVVDERIKIPMKGAGLSFNVSVACAIICYELARQ